MNSPSTCLIGTAQALTEKLAVATRFQGMSLAIRSQRTSALPSSHEFNLPTDIANFLRFRPDTCKADERSGSREQAENSRSLEDGLALGPRRLLASFLAVATNSLNAWEGLPSPVKQPGFSLDISSSRTR
jgi:hypothetical protein